jgi:adenylylsulfate kinase
VGLPKVLILSGSMGSGKTTVMGEASDLLRERRIPHAVIDLDAVSVHLVADATARAIEHSIAATFYSNAAEAGVDRFLVAVALEDRQSLQDLSRVFTNATIAVVRLIASQETMAARLRMREPGGRQAEFIERSGTLAHTLELASLENFTVLNDGREITGVAREVLERAGWT